MLFFFFFCVSSLLQAPLEANQLFEAGKTGNIAAGLDGRKRGGGGGHSQFNSLTPGPSGYACNFSEVFFFHPDGTLVILAAGCTRAAVVNVSFCLVLAVGSFSQFRFTKKLEKVLPEHFQRQKERLLVSISLHCHPTSRERCSECTCMYDVAPR